MLYPAGLLISLQPYVPAVLTAPSLTAISFAIAVDRKYSAGWAVFSLGIHDSLFLYVYQIATRNPPTQSAYYASYLRFYFNIRRSCGIRQKYETFVKFF